MKNWIKHFLHTLSPTIRRNDIESKFNGIIENFIDKCGSHHLINRPRVLNWILQFDEQSLSIPEKVLTNLRYYSASTLNKMAEELVEIVTTNIRCSKNDLYYVPVGGAGSGSQTIARIFRTKSNVKPKNVVNLHELYVNRKEEVQNKYIIFFDDFSGTGKTLTDWWKLNEPIILPLNATFVIAVIVLNHKAEDKVKSLNQPIFNVDFLHSNLNVFNNECGIFDKNEKQTLIKFCERTGCSTEYLKGFGECGLIVSFQHGCPNNSLPILWYDKDKWLTLFDRRN